MKSFFKFIFIILFCTMSVYTASATLQYTLTTDGFLTIHTEKEGEISSTDLIESTKYKHLVISGKLSSLDVHVLQLFAKHCISIDLTDTQVQFNMITPQTFTDFKYLEEFKCPKTITSIDAGSFYNCPNLRTIVLPKTLKKIGYDSFQICPNLEVEIPANVAIGKGSFSHSKVIIIDPIPEPEVSSCRCCSWLLDWMGIGSRCDEKKDV